MKKLVLLLSLICFSAAANAANISNYEQIYRDMPIPTHQYIHNIDPGENYDTKDTTWSPYPLFRLVAPLYFKSIAIEPGYYALTPREYKGDWYILFKEAGKIRYIIPVYNRDIVPETFYDENLPKPKLTFTQKFHIKALDFIGKHFKRSKRKPAPQTYLEVTDLDNNFVSLVIYYGNYRYYTIMRTIKL